MILNVLVYNDSDLFTWIILPILIFLSRIADQRIGTMMTQEEKISTGAVLVEIIPTIHTAELITTLRKQNFGSRTINAEQSVVAVYKMMVR